MGGASETCIQQSCNYHSGELSFVLFELLSRNVESRCTCTLMPQANYRGYSLRTRLRRVLENARYTDEGCAPRDRCEGGEGEDNVDFEEEIVVDYLDEVQCFSLSV